MPFSSSACEMFLSELSLCKTPVLKVIHGYGSTGKGGIIKRDLHQQLRELKKHKQIKDFLPGEKWSLFNDKSQQLIGNFPDLARDEDINRLNPGVTLIII